MSYAAVVRIKRSPPKHLYIARHVKWANVVDSSLLFHGMPNGKIQVTLLQIPWKWGLQKGRWIPFKYITATNRPQLASNYC